jgi:hypothetical protein
MLNICDLFGLANSLLCSHVWEAIRHVWPDAHFPGERQYTGLESRL